MSKAAVCRTGGLPGHRAWVNLLRSLSGRSRPGDRKQVDMEAEMPLLFSDTPCYIRFERGKECEGILVQKRVLGYFWQGVEQMPVKQEADRERKERQGAER